jgi:hypothetical protein
MKVKTAIPAVVFACLSILGAASAQATDNAEYISAHVPTTLAPGQVVPVSVTMTNIGTTTWTAAAGYKLGTQNPQDNVIWGFGRVLLASGDAIAPGQQKTFNFNLTAPVNAGTYNLELRMLVEGVAWFGAFTPNFAIQVGASGDQAYFVSQAMPVSMNVGQAESVSVTMANTGNTTWTNAAAYKLGTQNPQDNLTWGLGRAFLGSATVAPGQQFTFTFTITAPTSPGTYNLEFRMLREGFAWFGDYTPNVAVAVGAPCVETDLTAYFVPSYSGWQTAKRDWVGSDGSSNTERWFSYAANKYEHIKFSDPQSAETFAVDSNWIYITAENKINDTTQSRVWLSGLYGLGLRWLPRNAQGCPGCTPAEVSACNLQNNFVPCDSGTDYYTTCQFTSSGGNYCAKFGDTVIFTTYDYGYSIGTLASVIKHDVLDDGSAENYYYGEGRGLLRYEDYNPSGVLVSWAAQTGEVANQPIASNVCFQP